MRSCRWLLLGFLFSLSCTRKVSFRGPAPIYDKVKLMQALEAHNIAFDWISMEGKMDFDSPQQGGSGKVLIRMKKDSLLWLQGKRLSIEGVRMRMTPDSTMIRYTIDKKYQADETSVLLNSLGVPITFLDIQQMIVGNVPLPDPEGVLLEQEKADVKAYYTDSDFSYQYSVNAYTGYLDTLKLKDYLSRQVVLIFQEHQMNEGLGLVYPKKREILLPDQGILKIEVDKLEPFVQKNTPFDINSRYERIPF